MIPRKFFYHCGLAYFICLTLCSTVEAQSSGAASQAKSEKRAVYNDQTQQAVRLDIDYYAGMVAYNRRHWTHAILTFEKILAVDPNFREIPRKLAAAEKNLKREKTENILARYYEDAKLALERDDFGWARRAFEKINGLDPNYRDVPALLAEIEAVTSRNRETASAAEKFSVNAALRDSLYRAGINAGARGDWIQAVVNFEKLRLVAPNHDEVNSRLAQAWEQLTHAHLAETKTRSSLSRLQVGATVAGITIAAFFCFIGLRPTARARFQLWRGHHQAAAEIYERLLSQNPQRVKLYAPLADIYLRLGRNDERALKVYKSVIHFNLATSRRDEINGMVAQKYLTEGRTDTDAIEVLERALKSEMHKQDRALMATP